MNRREIDRLTPFHRGLDVNIYEPIVDGHNLLHLKGYNKEKIDWCDITITGRSVNPNPLHERDMHDIDEELSRIDSKFRIIKDHLKHTDNKFLVHEHQPTETLTRHTVILDHPYFDGENDHWRSKAKNIHTQTIPLQEVRIMEEHFKKRRAFYPTGRTMLKAIKKVEPDKNRMSDQDLVQVEIGEI